MKEWNWVDLPKIDQHEGNFYPLNWGEWQFNDNLTLSQKKALYYEVDLELMSMQEMLDWLIQVGYKTWCTKEDLADLVFAFDDIFEVQSQIRKVKNKESMKIKKYYLERSKQHEV